MLYNFFGNNQRTKELKEMKKDDTVRNLWKFDRETIANF
jgi:hypothetical protein